MGKYEIIQQYPTTLEKTGHYFTKLNMAILDNIGQY